MKRSLRTTTALVAIAAAGCLGMTACSNDKDAEPAKEATSAVKAATSEAKEATSEAKEAASSATSEVKKAADPRLEASVCGTKDDDGDNHEIPVGEAEHGPLHMEANYFQPGYMLNDGQGLMPAYKDSIAHIELDVKATKEATKLGYSVDETPADLQISYTVADESGKEIVSGDFVEMNAGDGSHYGTNIPKTAEAAGLVGSLDKPGKFKLTFHVAPPKAYDLHADKRTGIEAKEWFKPFDETMEWLYTGEQKKCIVDNPVDKDAKAPESTVKEEVVVAPTPKSDNDPRYMASVCGTDKDDGDNHEIPVGEAENGPLHMEINYFQPGMMLANPNSMMPAYKDSIAHLEMDVKATEEGTDYGWSVDETPADLQIDYQILDKTGKEIFAAPFMEMNAGDGSHYGTNVPKQAQENGLVGSLDNPGEYTLVFHVAPPKAYALHADKRTGVKVHEWFKPFTVKMPWVYTGEQLKCIVDDPMK